MAKEVVLYDILWGLSYEDLIGEVNDLLDEEDGWEPLGAMVVEVTRIEEGNAIYYQTMVQKVDY